MTVLNALILLKEEQDSRLAFRYSCRSGICGTCGVRAQGRSRLACETQVLDVEKNGEVLLEPLKLFPIIKDLVVDMDPMFENLRKVQPWLVRDPAIPVPEREYQIPADENLAKLTKIDTCVLCGICYAESITVSQDRSCIDPVSLTKALRFILDARDSLKEARLKQLAELGLKQYRGVNESRIVCPKGIHLQKEVIRPLLEALE